MKTQVLVIGGGPSGMIAALALAKCGVESLVLERRESPGSHPKAHEVSGRTLEILTSLGVSFREFEPESSPHEDASRIIFCRTLKEEIGRIDLGEKAIQEKYRLHSSLPRPYLNLSQTEFEKILRRHVAKNRLIRLIMGCEWKSLTQNAQGVSSVARRRNGEVMEIHSDFVLCCDGAGGRCRDFLGIRMSGPEKIQDFANAYFTDDLTKRVSVPAKLFFVFKPDAAGTFIAHHAGRRWVYHVPVMTPHEKIEDYTEEVFSERIARAVGDPHFRPRIESISWWRMTAQVATSFQAGRVFLVGDSAHRFPPTGGLGLNSGAADAHNLAWKIAAVLKGEAQPALLASYEKERKPVIVQNCEESRKNYRNLFDITSALGLSVTALRVVMACLAVVPLRWLGNRFRSGVLRTLYALADKRLLRFWRQPRLAARVREVVAAQMRHFDRIGLDLGQRYGVDDASAAIDPTHYEPAFTAGARLPVFTFRQKNRFVRSHQLIDYQRHVLLVPERDAATWRRAVAGIGDTFSVKVVAIPGTISLGGNLVPFADKAAILVRPDGHIAARLPATARGLTDYFKKTGYIVAAEARRGRIAS